MAQGEINHPSYVTRQMLNLRTAANSATDLSFPFDVRIRNAVATVNVAGTVAANKQSVIALGTSIQFPNVTVANGIGTATGTVTAVTTNTSTTTLGSLTAGTSTAGSNFQTGDMNARLPQGQVLQLANADATGVVTWSIEYYIDPVTGNWTGPN